MRSGTRVALDRGGGHMDSELPMDERVTMVDVDVDFDLHTEEQEAPRIPLRARTYRHR